MTEDNNTGAFARLKGWEVGQIILNEDFILSAYPSHWLILAIHKQSVDVLYVTKRKGIWTPEFYDNFKDLVLKIWSEEHDRRVLTVEDSGRYTVLGTPKNCRVVRVASGHQEASYKKQ